MRDARRVGAFFSGLFLYVAALVSAMGLSNLHLPRSVYQSLGGRNSVMVMAVEAALIALLLFVVALVWSTVSLKPPRRGRRPVNGWFMCGILSAWLGGLIYGAFYFALSPRSYQTLPSLLLESDAAPLWGLLNFVAIVAAALLGGRLAALLFPKPVTPIGVRSTGTTQPA